MKKYTIVLTGGKALEVDKERRDMIEAIWRDKSERLISIDGNTISASMIRGIFEKEVEDVSLSAVKAKNLQYEFDADCRRLSACSVEEKTTREMEIRIFPEVFVRRGWISSEVNRVYEAIKKTVKDFFIANPGSPQCPARLWFPMLKPYLNRSVADFYKSVGRNDEEAYKWMKKNGIHVVESFQVSMSQEEALPDEPESASKNLPF